MKFKADLHTFSLKFGERDDIFSKDVIPLEGEVLRFEQLICIKMTSLKKGCQLWIACKIQSRPTHISLKFGERDDIFQKDIIPFEGGIAEI